MPLNNWIVLELLVGMSKESSCCDLKLAFVSLIIVYSSAMKWVHFPCIFWGPLTELSEIRQTVKYWNWPREPKPLLSSTTCTRCRGRKNIRPVHTVQDKLLQLSNVHWTKTSKLWNILFVVMKIVSEANNCMCFAKSSSLGLLNFLGILFFFCLENKKEIMLSSDHKRFCWELWMTARCSFKHPAKNVLQKDILNASFDPSEIFFH